MRGDGMTVLSTAGEDIHWSVTVCMAGCLLWASMEAEMSNSALTVPIRFYALSADEIHTARTCDPTNPDYFSDVESERTTSVAEEYKEAERAEKGTAADNEDIPAQQLGPQKQNRPPSRKKHCKLAQQAALPPARTVGEMAGRGRGRPGGGGLKGVTWEYDPSIKLESKPIELFPVRMSGFKYCKFLTFPASSKSQATRALHRQREERNRPL
jgi:hypothetical protein